MSARGQSTLEYAVLATVVIGALLAMSVYMKRGLSGRLRTATEQVGDQFVPEAYQANFRTVETRSGQETLHVGNQKSGESHTDNMTVTVAGLGNSVVPGIHVTRTSEAGAGGVHEQTTNDLANDRLFR